MASKTQKDKRTKDQILRLLDDALVQEDRLGAEISQLKTQLDECRKRAENPRAEFQEEALPSSKVPFRLDFYRTAGNAPLKGIIEHLPSRQTRAFEGDGQAVLLEFVQRFLPAGTLATATPPFAGAAPLPDPPPAEPVASPSASPGKTPVPLPETGPDTRPSRLLNRLHGSFLREFPDLNSKENFA